MPVLSAVQQTLHGAGLPYGYTVTLSASGQLASHAHGPPSPLEIVLLAAGAIAGYGTLKVASRNTEVNPPRQLAATPHFVRAGVVQVSAIAVALALAALGARMTEPASWALVGLLATLAYLLGTSVEFAIEEARDEPAHPSSS